MLKKNQRKMSKIRKGSIVWDTIGKEKVKVLNNPHKGELPDGLFLNIGKKYHRKFVGTAVISQEIRNPYGPRFNNRPCIYRSIDFLIPYKEYLEIQQHLKIKYN